MESNTWERLEAIFFEALELPPHERSAFVEEACGGDPELRVEVEAVLAAHGAMDEEEGPEVPPDLRVGTRVGAYVLDSLIGRGGMGEVYRAHRADEEYEQEVAVKIVRSGLPPLEMARRFRLERQILARMGASPGKGSRTWSCSSFGARPSPSTPTGTGCPSASASGSS